MRPINGLQHLFDTPDDVVGDPASVVRDALVASFVGIKRIPTRNLVNQLAIYDADLLL